MKQNSSKPKTVGVPSKVASPVQVVSMAHGQHHHQLYQQQHQQQPSTVGHYQQMMQLPAGTSYPQHQQQHQPGLPPGVIVLPSVPTGPMSYGQQQPQQQRHKANGLDQAEAKMYLSSSQPFQLPTGGGFPVAVSAPGQPTVGCHHHQQQQQQQQQPMMMMSPQQQYHPSTQFSTMDFAGCQQFRPYSPQFQQTAGRLTPTPQLSSQQSQQAFPLPQQPASTTEAQYFLDPNCTVPMKQLPTGQPPARSGCSDPKCTNCKSR